MVQEKKLTPKGRVYPPELMEKENKGGEGG